MQYDQSIILLAQICLTRININGSSNYPLFTLFFVFRWGDDYCAMDSLYDMDLISKTVPVILDNARTWYHVMTTGMKLGDRGLIDVEGIGRLKLKQSNLYSNSLVINRTASPLSWYSSASLMMIIIYLTINQVQCCYGIMFERWIFLLGDDIKFKSCS